MSIGSQSHSSTHVPDVPDVRTPYERDGFYLPFDVIDEHHAQKLRADLEAAEALCADQPDDLALLRANPDRLLPLFDDLVRHPRLVAGVSQLLGEDLLAWNGGLFIKEPNSPSYVSWHQDLTYWGLNDAEEVTAWVALSPSTIDSGCMRFIPGSHKRNLVEHVDSFADDNLLTRGQEIAVEVNENEAASVILKPGQASLHHGHLFHSSGPNTTNDRRIGVAIRFIKPSMKQTGNQRTMVRLVSGTDAYGHFNIVGAPQGRLNEEDLIRCRQDAALRREVLFKGAQDAKGKRY